MLTEITHGDQIGRPLIIVHGLFGSARNWGAIAKRLAADRPVICVDMRNHGASFSTDSHSYPDLAADLADSIEAHGRQADILGHSMGGKAAMALALTHPDRVARLIVADIAPVTYGHSQTPLIAAMAALDLTAVTSRRDADDALRAAIPDPAVRAFLIQSLDLTGDTPRWRLNLPVLKAEMSKIVGWPEDLNSHRFDGPTLFLSGGASDYVLPEHRDLITTLFPQARFDQIAGAGHWLHAEAPAPFIDKVQAFLS